MYQQQQGYQQPANYGYPQQPGFVYGQSAGGYGYPQQPSYPQPGGPTVNLNMGPQSSNLGGGGGGGGGGGWAEPAGLFAEKAIRQAFVSKVYSILTVQLIFTSALIALFVLNNDTKMYFAKSQGWMFLGFLIFFISYLVLVCVESARRTAPMNFILLSVMTFGYGMVAAVVSCRYNTTTVMAAFLATGLSCLLIAVFAKSTTIDITNCGTTLCWLGLAHIFIGLILVLIFGPGKMTSLIMAVCGALLCSIYLMFDLQLIMGGRKCELSPEEYILGAVMLYVDIVQLFIYMLEIFSRLSDD